MNNNHLSGGTNQIASFKVKKNKLEDIPIYLNDIKVELLPNNKYTKVGDKYVFNTLGKIDSLAATKKINDYVYAVFSYVEVEAGEEDSFVPVINQGDYKPEVNEVLDKEKIKSMITNLPNNIKKFEILDPLPTKFFVRGKQKVRVRVTFSDDTFKEFDVLVNVYEKRYIRPIGTVRPNPAEVLQGKPVNISITRRYEEEDSIDEDNLIKYVADKIINYHKDNVPSGLVFNVESGYSGVIEYNFIGNEEEHTFVISHTEEATDYSWSDRIAIILLRDTDGDGIPDKDDDDKDGDGYSNAAEIAKGSDPYNKNSTPDMTKKKQLDELVKNLEKLINDTKNNPFNNKNKNDVDYLKNDILPDKENKKNEIKNSYNDTTPDSEIEKKKKEVQKHIDDINNAINNLSDKANFEELDQEIAKPIEDIYTPETVKPLKDKIEEAKKINRDTATQKQVDHMIKDIRFLRDRLVVNKEKLKEKIDELEKAINSGKCLSEECKKTLEDAKDLYNKPSITKEEMIDMIKRIDSLLNKTEPLVNPKTGFASYILVIFLIIIISFILFKRKKNYIR